MDHLYPHVSSVDSQGKEHMNKRYPGGRPRKSGPREPNGQPQRIHGKHKEYPEGLLAQRALCVKSENEKDPMAGDVLGQMRLNNSITQRQYLAGEKAMKLWVRWCKMAQVVRRHPKAITEGGGRLNIELDPADWMEVSNRLGDLLLKLQGLYQGGLVRSLVETVCMDNVVPPRLRYMADNSAKHMPRWSQGENRLLDGLDAAAAFFGLPEERNAA